MKKELDEAVQERLKSPIYFAFSLSWLAWNWPAILFALKSDKHVEYYIDELSNNYFDAWHSIVFPLLTAMVVLVVFQFIQTGIDWVCQYPKKWRNDIKYSSETQISKDREEYLAQERKYIMRLESNLNYGAVLKKFNFMLDMIKILTNHIDSHDELMQGSIAIIEKQAKTIRGLNNINHEKNNLESAYNNYQKIADCLEKVFNALLVYKRDKESLSSQVREFNSFMVFSLSEEAEIESYLKGEIKFKGRSS